MFWLDDNCAAGFYSVGQRVCLRCPAGYSLIFMNESV
jgi:hypothetical protein